MPSISDPNFMQYYYTWSLLLQLVTLIGVISLNWKGGGRE